MAAQRLKDYASQSKSKCLAATPPLYKFSVTYFGRSNKVPQSKVEGVARIKSPKSLRIEGEAPTKSETQEKRASDLRKGLVSTSLSNI